MDLKMDIYTPGLDLVGTLEIQRSVIWDEKAFSAGSFSVESLISDSSRALLLPENIIWIEGQTAGIIEHISQKAGEDGPYITVRGRDLTGILDRRILWGLYDLTGTVPEIMNRLVEDCCINPTRGDVEARKIPGLVLSGAASGGEKIRCQKTGGTLLEALEELGESYNVAFGVRFNPSVPRMEFWARPGVDRSVHQNINEPVFYSTELDDVLSSEYTYDSSKYRTIALVSGEGEGVNRTMITVEAPEDPEPAPPAPDRYTVALSVDPQGGGIVSGGGTVEGGAQVTVTAAPASGYTFSGWRESGSIVSTSRSYTFTVTSDRSLTAVFAAAVQSYSIVTSVDPAGAGTASGGGAYTQGQSVTLQATPASGYQFVAWKEGDMNVSTDASYTFTAGGNRTITAVFAAITYTVTASIDPEGSGTASGGGTYQQGTSVTLTAAPGEEYKFVKWTENGQTVSESASYTFTVSGDRVLVAVFEAEQTSRLPAGYTEVEWIQASTVASYIDTKKGVNNSDFIVKFQIPEVSGFYTASASSYAVYSSKFGIFKNGNNSTFFMRLTSSSSTSYSSYILANNLIKDALGKEFIIAINGKSVTINGESQTASSYNIYGNNLMVGSTNPSGTIRVKFKYMKGSRTSVTSSTYNFELIPCINPSGVVGLYDITNNEFIGPTAGSFTAGPAV